MLRMWQKSYISLEINESSWLTVLGTTIKFDPNELHDLEIKSLLPILNKDFYYTRVKRGKLIKVNTNSIVSLTAALK